jgi:aryl-alcohol dehydrogenase-like predicted oxidoreductase
VRKAVDGSLKRLGLEIIDLWYAHYPDPGTPIEDTVGAMAEAVLGGKVRYLGLSNVTAEQVRKAHMIHPIAGMAFFKMGTLLFILIPYFALRIVG